MTQISFSDLIQVLEAHYPKSLAEDWDPVGMHFGQADSPVHKVMTSLDARPNVVKEAIERGVDTLVVHHPPIFSPIKSFDYSKPLVSMIQDILSHRLNIYAMHTNVDRALDGMNDWLAAALGLDQVEPLGGFSDSGQPAMPRIGEWAQAKSLDQVIQVIEDKLTTAGIRTIGGQPGQTFRKLAICGGAGMSFLPEVIQSQADLYITGDVTFHPAQEALEAGLVLVDAGHYIESIFIGAMQERISRWSQELNWPIQVLASQESTDPFTRF